MPKFVFVLVHDFEVPIKYVATVNEKRFRCAKHMF